MHTDNLNRNLQTKTTDKFYVKFLGVDENTSNILGRQVMSVERPVINFDMSELREKMIPSYIHSIIRFDPITIDFRDDVNGAVTKILYDSLIAQNDHTLEDFDIRIEVLDNVYTVVDYYILKRCYIQNVVGSGLNYADSTDALISVTIGFETVEFDNTFEFFDPTVQGGT